MDISPPDGSFMFIWASERTGFMHLYLYQYLPGADSAVEMRAITSGDWVVESIVGVDQVSANSPGGFSLSYSRFPFTVNVASQWGLRCIQ